MTYTRHSFPEVPERKQTESRTAPPVGSAGRGRRALFIGVRSWLHLTAERRAQRQKRASTKGERSAGAVINRGRFDSLTNLRDFAKERGGKSDTTTARRLQGRGSERENPCHESKGVRKRKE